MSGRTVRARVDDELAARVDALMVAEERSESDVVRRALREYADARSAGVDLERVPAGGALAGGEVEVAPVDRVAADVPASPPASALPKANVSAVIRETKLPKRKLARKVMCEHRLQPSQWCKVCDG